MEDKCKLIREKILNDVKNDIERLGIEPTLAIIKVNNDYASSVYVRNKVKTCESVGIKAEIIELNPDETDYNKLHNTIIKAINENDSIIIQFPLCDKFKQYENELLKIIPYYKDCDGIVNQNILNLYNNYKSILPCTVGGIDKLLKYHNIDIKGKNVVVIGRSKIVGKPMAQLMINQDATVTVCHSKTPLNDIWDYVANADIVVCAIGKPEFINNWDFQGIDWSNKVLIDVGTNRVGDEWFGDISQQIKDKSYAYTPVPGGVGPMTITSLLQKVMDRAE